MLRAVAQSRGLPGAHLSHKSCDESLISHMISHVMSHVVSQVISTIVIGAIGRCDCPCENF